MIENNFNDALHSMSLSEDGSFTAYSKEYGEHYHSTKDGALYESLIKHVIPALTIQKDKEELNILDICFGLGFNTLATIYYLKQNNLTTKVNIYSPELDANLVNSLVNFTYPKEFESIEHIIFSIVENGFYTDEQFRIEVFFGDARKYILNFEEAKFDIIYQDAFSPASNPMLWTKEYFADIKRIIKEDSVLTTYSIALATRLALYENDFTIYINSGEEYRDATLASPSKLGGFKVVDMQHKISCNPDASPLRD